MTTNIIAAVVLVVVLISGLYYYNVKMVSDDEARIADIQIPTETRKMKNVLDIVERTKLRWKDAISIRGWVCKENAAQEKRDMYLVLSSKNNSFIYKITKSSLSRPDVSAALHLDSLVDSHGFVVTFPAKELIKGDSYKVGFVIMDGTGKYYVSANKNLIIPDDGSPLKVEAGSDPGTIAHKVDLKFVQPTREITCCFDKVKQSGDYINVTGWGFLKGMNAGSKNTFILLKKDKKVTVYDVSLILRADVTRVLIKEKLNLDSSGFTSSIPISNLESGNYEVGLYIINGNQAGIVYNKKPITIEK
ncbi:MAG: hypothetical protein NTW16_08900 [Bacteroidetes bacterium]|nr:hypothetical protein [Bacteroidota bacterium]